MHIYVHAYINMHAYIHAHIQHGHTCIQRQELAKPHAQQAQRIHLDLQCKTYEQVQRDVEAEVLLGSRVQDLGFSGPLSRMTRVLEHAVCFMRKAKGLGFI